MKDKWLKDLHDLMSEFEMDTPDNLWAEIEKAEEKRCAKPKSPVWVWIRRYSSVAAAAIVAMLIGGYILFNNSSDITPYLESPRFASESISPEEESDMRDEDPNYQYAQSLPEQKNPANAHRQTSVESISDIKNDISPIELSDQMNRTDIGSKLAEVSDKKDETPSDTTVNPYHLSDNTSYGNHYQPLIASNHNCGSRFSVSLFSSGGINSNMSQTSVIDGLTSTGPDGVDWEDEPLLGILLFNRDKEITTDIKHRQPIRAGVSFNYKLTDRIGLGTGISYTNLTSDIRSGSESHYFTGEQTLHYIGIPLNISYDVFRWKRLRLYVSAGVLSEKCVSGKITTDYVLDNNTAQTETENVEKKPFQFSLNATAGIQFNIIDFMGVYAEPGASYYFNDGTDIKTIYKDKPLNLNLNFGLRFSIGK